MKKISTKPARNAVSILLLTSIAIGVIFLSNDITPIQHKVEKVIETKTPAKS